MNCTIELSETHDSSCSESKENFNRISKWLTTIKISGAEHMSKTK